LLGGSSYSNAGGDKTDNDFGYEQTWIVKTDSLGNKLWDKTIYTNGEDEYGYPIQAADGCYVIANWSFADSAGYKTEMSRGNYDFWFVKFCETALPQYPVAGFSVSTPTVCASGCFSFENLSFDAGAFQWYFPGGTPSSSTDAFPSSVCYADTGHYAVTLIAINSSGSDTITISNAIYVVPLPLFNVTQNADTLFAPPGYAVYQWYLDTLPIPGAAGNYYVVTQNGNYSVHVADTNSCPSVEPFTVTNFIPPVSSFTVSDSVICSGSCIGFNNTTTGASSYQWIFQGATPNTDTTANPQNICYNTAGDYDVTLISTNFAGSNTLTLAGTIHVQALPAVTVSQNADTIFTASNFSAYQWYHDTAAINLATNYYYIVTQNGNYHVVVTDSNGCQGSGNITVTNVGIEDAASAHLSIYPNPVYDGIHFVLNGLTGSCTLYMVNMIGQVVYSKELDADADKHYTVKQKFTAGVYTITLKAHDAVYTRRIVVRE